MVIKVCQGSTKALRNHLQAHHKNEFADMVKEEEEEEEKKEEKEEEKEVEEGRRRSKRRRMGTGELFCWNSQELEC